MVSDPNPNYNKCSEENGNGICVCGSSSPTIPCDTDSSAPFCIKPGTSDVNYGGNENTCQVLDHE